MTIRRGEEILLSLKLAGGPLVFSWADAEAAIEQAQREAIEAAARLIETGEGVARFDRARLIRSLIPEGEG